MSDQPVDQSVQSAGQSALPADQSGFPAGLPDPAAVPRARLDRPEVTAEDLIVLREQLGRPARGVVGVAARCICGRPLVVRTSPRLGDGSPFPTTYYLTAPPAVVAASSLEAVGLMAGLTAWVSAEPVAGAYLRAHEAYLADRAELGDVPEIAGVSAGGMPTRVKCLHALLGHALAAGPGVNPVGDEVLLRLRGVWSPERCTC